ncbi:TRAP transporter small permease [Palleronia sp.]|uniref:TRAP transporter small permease n=1 Tax=Palleronia sp. TaxID=1940284 RepID=UPI0035C84C99
MRLFLDRLYAAALILSALGFAAIAALVLFQVVGRLIDRFARLAGVSPPGLTVPSLAELGSFLFLGAVFLGLAGTFVRGGHVRVSLLTNALPAGAARVLSAVVAAIAAGLSTFATWSSWLQTADSWAFDSVSFGMLRIPLWLPQGVMTLGLALLTIALIDALVVLIRGGAPSYEVAEAGAGVEG